VLATDDALKGERNIQTAVAKHLRLRAMPGLWWAAINNNPRSAIAGALAKAAGCRAGVPDLLLMRAGKPFALELKKAGGRLSPAQRTMHKEMRAAGCEVATAVGIDAAIAQLQAWSLLR
jgi:VRR-NUC domain